MKFDLKMNFGGISHIANSSDALGKPFWKVIYGTKRRAREGQVWLQN